VAGAVNSDAVEKAVTGAAAGDGARQAVREGAIAATASLVSSRCSWAADSPLLRRTQASSEP
jgi:hypothetical protein